MKTCLLFLLGFACCLSYAQYHPDFPSAKYPVTDIFHGTPAPAQPTSEAALRFRTVIESQAKKGPNFAGHYTVETWGCGAACASFAMVDAKDGKVWEPPFPTVGFQDAQGFFQHTGLYYQVNSSLFVLQGCPDGKDCAEHSYQWDGSELQQVNTQPLARARPVERKTAK